MRRLLGSMVVTLVVVFGAGSAAHANNGNGNGNGKPAPHADAPDDHGKPCDGCVGNADDKQPPGQSANDKNNGYECDGNHGIGQGNPAHSPCPTTTSTTVKPTVAAAPTTTTTVATAVLGEHFVANATTTSTVPTQVLGEHFARGELANTGGPAWLMSVGVPLVLIGFGLVTLQRRMAARAEG